MVWLVVGNAGTNAIATLLERHVSLIESFAASPDDAILVLRLPR